MSISQNYSATRPSLNLNFARSRSLDPRITFTRASTATFTDEDGVIKTAAADTPRFDYDPISGECLGLLIEEARTNLALRSEDFSDATWLKSGGTTCSANVATGPDGNTTADKLVEFNGTANQAFEQTNTLVLGTAYSISIYVKAAERIQCRLAGRISSNWVVFPSGRFDLSTGTVLNSSGDKTATISAVGNGWYRCTIYGTSAVATNAGMIVSPLLTGGTVSSYAGDGTSGLLIWGAQLEVGSFPTSYVPSTQTFTSRASSATYFDSTGVLQTAATNVARTAAFLPDSGGVFRSAGPLLLEGAATNLVRNNTMVGAVAGSPGTPPTNGWVILNDAACTSSIIGTGTESGINYIDIQYVIAPATSATGLIYADTPSATSSTSYAGSYYLKLVSGTAPQIRFIFQDNSNTYNRPFFTLTSSLTRYTDVYTTSATGTLARFAIGIDASASGTTFVIRVGMPQTELGTFPTSVISTSGATATRSADVSSSSTTTRATDVAMMTGTNFSTWYNPTEGTFFANYVERAFNVTHQVTTVSNGTANERISLLINSTNTLDAAVISGGTDTFGGNTPTLTAQGYRIGFGYKADNSGVSVNGSAITVDSAVTLPTVSQLNVGARAGSSQILNSTISRLSYYPVRLSDSQLQSLTK
jgi:hypothetical protein